MLDQSVFLPVTSLGTAVVLGLALSATRQLRWAVIAALIVLAIPATRRAQLPLNALAGRVARCCVGLVFFGIGIASIFAANLGLGPWDVLHEGLSKTLDIPVGMIINLVGIALLVIWIPLREPLGLGTVLNALLIGLVLDAVRPTFGEPHLIVARVIFLLGGMLAIAIGSALYLGARLGAGPRDGIMMSMNRVGLSIQVSRSIIEVAALAIGLLLGGTVGIGTLVFALGIGPLVQRMMRFLPAVEGPQGAGQRPAPVEVEPS